MGSWKALETLKDQKKIRSIGVSNYGVHHLEELKAKGTIAPTVNQVEVHFYLQNCQGEC
jgi:diketogulonate reductase-like aldo/keto reductase